MIIVLVACDVDNMVSPMGISNFADKMVLTLRRLQPSLYVLMSISLMLVYHLMEDESHLRVIKSIILRHHPNSV